MIIIDELDRRSISKTLDLRLDELHRETEAKIEITKGPDSAKTIELDGTETLEVGAKESLRKSINRENLIGAHSNRVSQAAMRFTTRQTAIRDTIKRES